ncbi:MAG: ABC transporter ATP-binding protein [Lachnospiraceae bacterium]|nr:ABC transporter ATP-binding protein [Lachnospiraceae bacterium]
MGEHKESKRPLREEWRLIRRALGILGKMMPHFWFYQILCCVAETFTPYFGLYMSARMVNELAGAWDYRRLLLLAGVTVAGGFVLSMAVKWLQSRRALCEEHTFQRHEAFLADAQNGFKYEHLENPDVLLQRAEILAGVNATGAGLMVVKWQIGYLMGNLLGVLFSASLTVSMFARMAPGRYEGVFGFFNSPASALGILVLILVNVFLSIKISAACAVRQRNALGGLARDNTHYSAFSRLWGPDMVVFGLNRIVVEELYKRRMRFGWVRELERVTIRYNSLSILVEAALNMAIFFFVAARAFIGAFGIGSFILYQGAVKRFISAVSGMASQFGALRQNNVYLTALYEYLDLSDDMYRGTLAVEKREDIDYEIEFRDVSFRYPHTETWALRHVSMKFRIGEKLAIVGENGSGKTTFIKLLCRLYDPTEGKILLNGIDITRYRYQEYMALFSVVFQDFSIFGFPLGENVAVSLHYDEDRVRDCLRRVGLGHKAGYGDLESKAWGRQKEHSSLQKGIREGAAGGALCSPEGDAAGGNMLQQAIGRGYDAGGIDFSGGEMQKIALARALYKDAPFVVLDEPTAALDPIAEAAVYENFNTLVKNKTAVFISHRLSSCRFCDSIAVFDHGRLIQQGSHDVLAAEQEGKYSQLWQAQAQYYKKEA